MYMYTRVMSAYVGDKLLFVNIVHINYEHLHAKWKHVIQFVFISCSNEYCNCFTEWKFKAKQKLNEYMKKHKTQNTKQQANKGIVE